MTGGGDVRALVTGAHGLLGSAVCEALAAGGWTVAPAGRPQVQVPSPAFDSLLRYARPGLVVHCAGPASVPASIEDPTADFEGSVGVLSALLDRLAALESAPRLVLISSGAVYGEPAWLPVSEDAPLEPISPYGHHRVACEQLAREHAEAGSVPAVSLRVFSAYGEGLRRQALWDICRKALEDDEVLLLGTGEESRDFVHARDVAQAVVVAARGAAFEGEAYNVGTGKETTIAELASLLVAALGVDKRIAFTGERRHGDPARWQADIERLAGLGYEPAVAIAHGATAYARWAETAGRA